MTSETNRKRRKLDRERRAIDRPQPSKYIKSRLAKHATKFIAVRDLPLLPHDVPTPPTLRDIVKASFDSSSESTRSKKRRQPPISSLVYPQLTTLRDMEVTDDLQFFYFHTQRVTNLDAQRQGLNPGVLPPNAAPRGGHGFEPFGMGMMVDSFPQQPPPPHMQQMPMHGQPGPGFPPPRGQPHPGPPNLPMSGQQPMLEYPSDSVVVRRPPSDMPVHPFPSGPGSVPVNATRRSMSPHLMNANGLPAGSKQHNWMGSSQPGPSSLSNGPKESKRMNGGDFPMHDREKERMVEAAKHRDRIDLEREEAALYSRAPHARQHIHPSASAHQHTGPHHHHQHHHHIHHHHHPNPAGGNSHGSNNPAGQGPSGLPVNGMAPGAGGNLSPHATRDVDIRRPHSGAPQTEIIDLSPPSKQSLSASSSHWRGNEDPLTLSDPMRDRGKPPAGSSSGPHDRITTPFVMTPSPAVTGGLSNTSPWNMSGPPNHPGSNAPSRRPSWSAGDEGHLPRPSSSSGQPGNPPLPGPSHRHTSSHSHSGRPQVSPSLQPQRTPNPSSPIRNGIRLPPLSPSNTTNASGHMRSPSRNVLSLPASQPHPAIPPHSGSRSPPKNPSPRTHRHSPPLTRSPLIRDHGGSSQSMSTHRNSSPLTMFPPPTSLSTQSSLPTPPSSRLPGGVGMGPEKHSPNLPSAPKMTSVPVEGS